MASWPVLFSMGNITLEDRIVFSTPCETLPLSGVLLLKNGLEVFLSMCILAGFLKLCDNTSLSSHFLLSSPVVDS